MTDTALTPTNQDGATDAEKTAARKTEAIDRIQQLFNQLKERGHESMEPQRVTIVSHPEDFQLKPLGHTGVMYLSLVLGMNVTRVGACAVTVYRLSGTHEVAFGAYTQEFPGLKDVDVFVTMRPMRFVNEMVPSTFASDELDAAMEPIDKVIKTLEDLLKD